MKQQTLAMAADQGSGFEQHRKPTRRDQFLKAMDAIVPWTALSQVIEPHYPKAGNGRRALALPFGGKIITLRYKGHHLDPRVRQPVQP